MHLYFVLLAFAALLALVDATTTTGNLKMAGLVTESQKRFTPQSLLRVNNREKGAEEERTGISVSNLEKVKTVLTSSKISEKTLQRWVKKQKSPSDAFARFQLTKAGDKLLDNPKFTRWVGYVDELNAKNPGKAFSAIPTLTAQYGDDALSQILIAAKQTPATEKIAIKLQAEQVQSWLANGKSADDVFELLMLKKPLKLLMDTPEFSMWVKYVDDLNAKNPAKMVSIFPTLTAHYGDRGISAMLILAKRAPRNEEFATKLQAKLIQVWQANGKPSYDVFGLLMLNNAEEKLFTNPLFRTWIKYVDDLNAKNPGNEKSVISTLTSYYGDNIVAKIIVDAKGVADTKSLATKLQGEQLNKWLITKTDPRNVHKWLNVKGAASDSAERLIYRKYLNDFIRRNSQR